MEFINVSLRDGLKMAEEKEKYRLIDVREPYRYEKQHLKGAVNRPYGILQEEDYKEKKDLIVYCDFGGQSMMAARHLAKEGFRVYNIVGGVYYYLEEWKDG